MCRSNCEKEGKPAWLPSQHLFPSSCCSLLCFFSFHISFLAHSGSFSSTCCAGRKVENRSCEITDRHFLLSPSLSPSLPLSLPVSVGLSVEVGEWRKRGNVLFLFSPPSQFCLRARITWPALSFTSLSPPLSLSPSSPLPPSLTHSKDYGSRERSTSVRTRKWIYWFSLL